MLVHPLHCDAITNGGNRKNEPAYGETLWETFHQVCVAMFEFYNLISKKKQSNSSIEEKYN